MIFDHYPTIQEWVPYFNLAKVTIESMTVWARFPELPMEYYEHKCLKVIRNRIGKIIKIDFITKEKNKREVCSCLCFSESK